MRRPGQSERSQSASAFLNDAPPRRRQRVVTGPRDRQPSLGGAAGGLLRERRVEPFAEFQRHDRVRVPVNLEHRAGDPPGDRGGIEAVPQQGPDRQPREAGGGGVLEAVERAPQQQPRRRGARVAQVRRQLHRDAAAQTGAGDDGRLGAVAGRRQAGPPRGGVRVQAGFGGRAGILAVPAVVGQQRVPAEGVPRIRLAEPAPPVPAVAVQQENQPPVPPPDRPAGGDGEPAVQPQAVCGFDSNVPQVAPAGEVRGPQPHGAGARGEHEPALQNEQGEGNQQVSEDGDGRQLPGRPRPPLPAVERPPGGLGDGGGVGHGGTHIGGVG